MKILIILVMLNLTSFFRILNLENTPYKFGTGKFFKFIGPIGAIIASFICKEELDNKITFILGLIFNIVIGVSLFILL